MKRSELVKEIKDVIENSWKSSQTPDEILNRLLELGCLPPSRKLDYTESQALRMYNSPAEEFKFYHSFEQEDETPAAKPFEHDDIPF